MSKADLRLALVVIFLVLLFIGEPDLWDYVLSYLAQGLNQS
jgi:hypothetical protein